MAEAFSSRGDGTVTLADGLAKPDVVAPGAHIVSLRSVGSTIDQQFPDYVDGAYHRGSGTSFSAAATSGVVALMLARNPLLSPSAGDAAVGLDVDRKIDLRRSRLPRRLFSSHVRVLP